MYNMVNNVNKIPMNIDLYSLDFFLNFALIENFDRVLFEVHFYDKYSIYLKICLKELFLSVIEIHLFYFMK